MKMWSTSLPSSRLRSNLQRFLRSITPVMPSKRLPHQQSCIHDLNSPRRAVGKDMIEYFTLGDLWGCYDEWSSYGAGTRIVLSNSEEDLVQYYVPYLSAIQIYTIKSSRNPREDTDIAEHEVEFWSDDSESDRLSRSLSNNSSKTWDVTSPDSSNEHDSPWSTSSNLYFQYFETCSPYWRIPLVDKITDFAQNNSGFLTLRSVDLSPASWMAVSWYPIYHIPTKGNLKDLSTCFLTYHTLSSSFQDSAVESDEDTGGIYCSKVVPGRKSKGKRCEKISLPPFGLATYKLQGDLWINPETCDYERLIDLHSAAGSWLRQLSVQHHDFNFFTSHSTMEIAMPF